MGFQKIKFSWEKNALFFGQPNKKLALDFFVESPRLLKNIKS
jgi:hypothetical protein